jgi:hypothetical protein
MIQDVMARAMRKGEHYGVIPGTGSKPTLLKAGAEKLCLLFNLVPEYVVEKRYLPGSHLDVSVKCRLIQRHTGRFFGEGQGNCCSLESKYRYRTEWKTINDRRIKERIENPDPADQWNTVVKIGCKRAYVAATISATAASDIFTQDIEEKAQPGEPQSGMPQPVGEDIKGKVADTYTHTQKDGKPSWGARIGEVSVWTKEESLGITLIDAEGFEVAAKVVINPKSGKGRLLSLLTLEPTQESIAQTQTELEPEPDDIPV